LTETLDKVKPRNPKTGDAYKPFEFKEETVTKEIANSHKQIEMYKREVHFLRDRVESNQSDSKVIRLENLLKEKSMRITDLTTEIKNLEKAKKDQERELDMYYNEDKYIQQMNSCAEDVKALRSKMRELQEKKRTEEHHFKSQEEYIEKLKKSYVENCGRLKKQPNLEMPKRGVNNARKQSPPPAGNTAKDRAKSKNRVKSIGRKGEGNDSDDENEDTMEVNEENFNKLKKKKKIFKNNGESLGKKYGRQIDLLEGNLKKYEEGKKELERKAKDKEKEIELLASRVKDYKKQTRHNQLEPIKDKNMLNKSLSRETMEVNPKKDQYPSQPAVRKEVIGKEGNKDFDDKSALSGRSVQKITKIIVWYDDDYVFGI